MNITEVARDIAREGSIRRLANQMKVELLLENHDEGRRLFELMRSKVLMRSAVQVHRMGQELGLHP